MRPALRSEASKLAYPLSIFRKFLPVGISIALLAIVYWKTKDGDFSQAFRLIDVRILALAFGLLMLAQLLAAARYWSILRTFRLTVPRDDAARAVFLGMAASLVFSVIGLAFTRWMVLRRHGLSLPMVVLSTAYEKLLALAVLGLFGGASAVALFGSNVLDHPRQSIPISALVALMVVSTATVALTILRPYAAPFLRAFRHLSGRRVGLDLALTILVHGSVASAYLVLVREIAADVPLFKLGLATLVVMLFATIPISFAGWGLREFGALFAFGAVGVDATHIFVVSLAFGTLTMIAIASSGALASWGGKDREEAPPQRASNLSAISLLFDFSVRFAPLLVALLVPFQAWVRSGTGYVNVNFADPFAVGCGLLFLVAIRRAHLPRPTESIRTFALFLAGPLLVIGIGILIGYSRFGLTNWALVNRGVGTAVVLAYFLTGSLAVLASPRFGASLLVRILLVVCAIVAIHSTVPMAAVSFGLPPPWAPPFQWQARGTAGDPNAFGFQLLMVLAGVFAMTLARRRVSDLKALAVPVLLVLVGLLATQSRSTYVVFVVLLLATLGLNLVRGQTGRTWLKAAFAFVVFVGVLGAIFSALVGYQAPIVRPGSDSLHWRMATEGLQLFRSHPFFGAGIGAHLVLNSSAAAPEGWFPLVLHSSWIWLLAETGLFGTLFFATLFAGAFIAFVRRYVRDRRFEGALGALVIIAFVVFGLPHDIFYQRFFWLLLGASVMSLLLSPTAPGAPEERR